MTTVHVRPVVASVAEDMGDVADKYQRVIVTSLETWSFECVDIVCVEDDVLHVIEDIILDVH